MSLALRSLEKRGLDYVGKEQLLVMPAAFTAVTGLSPDEDTFDPVLFSAIWKKTISRMDAVSLLQGLLLNESKFWKPAMSSLNGLHHSYTRLPSCFQERASSSSPTRSLSSVVGSCTTVWFTSATPQRITKRRSPTLRGFQPTAQNWSLAISHGALTNAYTHSPISIGSGPRFRALFFVGGSWTMIVAW